MGMGQGVIGMGQGVIGGPRYGTGNRLERLFNKLALGVELFVFYFSYKYRNSHSMAYEKGVPVCSLFHTRSIRYLYPKRASLIPATTGNRATGRAK